MYVHYRAEYYKDIFFKDGFRITSVRNISDENFGLMIGFYCTIYTVLPITVAERPKA
jgi:hypothetical protein